MKLFEIKDSQTGEAPDLVKIVREEPWAGRLVYSSIDGFTIDEDGTLYLLDGCGNYSYPPEGRFEIIRLSTEETK